MSKAHHNPAKDRKPAESHAALKRTRKTGDALGVTSLRSHGGPETDTIDVVSMAAGSEGGHRRAVQYENTYKMEPESRFTAFVVERIARNALEERLRDLRYDPAVCKQLSQELAATIMERTKALAYKRYKFVTVVSLGSLKERPGMQFGSRCLWNQKTDNFATVKYTNGSIFGVAMVYGLYFE